MKSGGLIGFGYWGQILLKTLKKSYPDLKMEIFDISLKARKSAVRKGHSVCSSLKDLLSKDISFLIVSAPPCVHYSLVEQGLLAGKNILVEKPFGKLSKNKEPLFKLAKKQKKVLMVDWTYLYSPGFQKLKELLSSSKLVNYESLRCNSDFVRTDINVLEDLAIHDLAMLLDIAPSKPIYCSCQSLKLNKKTVSQEAMLSITGYKYKAFIYVSRVFSEKQRLVLVKSAKKKIEFKELGSKTLVRLLDSRKSKNIPVKNKTGLEIMFEEFFNRINNKSSKDDCLRYKKISSLLKALNKSLELDGKKIKI